MDKLRTWLSKQGFRVEIVRGEGDFVDFGERTVTIDSSKSYQIRLSSLIHECGHVRIFLRRRRNPRDRICGSTLREFCRALGRRDARGRSSRISVLQEELDAWDVGMELAKKLSIRYTRKIIEKDRVKALMTYIQYTAAPMRMRT
jgi:hypothetical protein